MNFKGKEIEDITFEELGKDLDKEEIPKEETVENPKPKQDIKINFAEEDYSETLTAKKTVEQNTDSEGNEQDDKGNKQSDKKEEQKVKADELSDLDYQDMSEFLIEIIDLGISSGLKMWSKDKGVGNKYEAPFAKKQKLIRMLSKILAKHQFGLSIESLFCITLVMVYYQPAKDALKARKEKNEKEEQKTGKIQKLNEESNGNTEQESGTEEERIRKSGRPKKSA